MILVGIAGIMSNVESDLLNCSFLQSKKKYVTIQIVSSWFQELNWWLPVIFWHHSDFVHQDHFLCLLSFKATCSRTGTHKSLGITKHNRHLKVLTREKVSKFNMST